MITMRLGSLTSFALLTVAGSALASPTSGVYTIPRYGVVPAVMNDKLQLNTSHRGDSFSATVPDDRDLPRGTKFVGHVRDIHPRDGDHAATMDMSFDTVIYPDGSRQDIEAVPVPIDARGIRRDSSGHYRASANEDDSGKYVIGGLAGGLGIGGLLFHKPLEGAIIGILGGIFASEASKHDPANQDTFSVPGARVGVMFEQPLHVNYMSGGASYIGARSGTDRYGRRGDDNQVQGQSQGQGDSGSQGRDRYGNPIGADNNPPAGQASSQPPVQPQGGDSGTREGKDRFGNPIGSDDAASSADLRSSNMKVSYDGRDLQFSDQEKPYREGKYVMVPVLSIARQLDLTVDTADDSSVFFVEDDSNSLRLERDSTAFRLNGKRGTLAQKVVQRDGVLYAPLDIIAAMKDRPVYVNGTKLIKMSYN